MTKKDTRKGDRHRPGYFKEYMRAYRARKKAAKLALEHALTNNKEPAG
jgi:hypothetical protein